MGLDDGLIMIFEISYFMAFTIYSVKVRVSMIPWIRDYPISLLS